MMKKILRVIAKTFVWLIIFSWIWVLVYKFLPVPATPLMFLRAMENDATGLSWKHDWISLEEMSPHLPLAVVSSEDQLFLTHNGFDIKAIEKAIEYNQKGRRTRGASTISQQTAKNVFLWPQRSWLRKGLEAYFTFLIELAWSKERIMEVYLNSIEMGPGIYGAEAAAKHWFNKPALKLTREESAALAAILPSPLRYKARPASAYIQGRKNWILKQMNNLGTLKFNP